ncbi:unnamed protein product [Tetraodon nigroviridis]|uniref:(spotted green pufferfish) hypothetical protein n=1 Tax=Tetraodon nigroviridis TaxID=99883 RepID=Q4S027_TETNG|nr:unnamed protein product [Tetraodon nigroviridis]
MKRSRPGASVRRLLSGGCAIVPRPFQLFTVPRLRQRLRQRLRRQRASLAQKLGHGAGDVPRRPLLRPPGQRLPPGPGGSGAPLRGGRRRHHGSVLAHLRGGAAGQHPGHVRGGQVHQDEDGHQHLHLQPGAGRRPGHQHAALPERQVPAEHLALRGAAVQADRGHRLLQHVHQHPHAHHDERGPLRGRVPPGPGPGLPHAGQGQADQRPGLGAVLRHRRARHRHGRDQGGGERESGVRAAVPGAGLVLGHRPQDLRLRLRLRGSRAGHQRLLRPDDPAPEERAPALGLQGEGPQHAPHHPHGAGGGGGLRGLLDAHPHLHHGEDGGGDRRQGPAGGGRLAPVHRAGLHQQQPQPAPLRLPGRELQEVLPGFLPPLPEPDAAGPPGPQPHRRQGARLRLHPDGGGQGAGVTRPGRGPLWLQLQEDPAGPRVRGHADLHHRVLGGRRPSPSTSPQP